MPITLKDIIALTKELPEGYFEEAFEKLTEIKKKAEVETEVEAQCWPILQIRVNRTQWKKQGQTDVFMPQV